jgi:hypothetical protein
MPDPEPVDPEWAERAATVAQAAMNYVYQDPDPGRWLALRHAVARLKAHEMRTGRVRLVHPITRQSGGGESDGSELSVRAPGGRLPDPGPDAVCECGQPRNAHGGAQHLGACPGGQGLYAPRFRLRDDDKTAVES